MAKGDYPTGALVEVLRKYKTDGGSEKVYEQAKQELKNLMLSLVKLESSQQSEKADECQCSAYKKHNFKSYTMARVELCEYCGTHR